MIPEIDSISQVILAAMLHDIGKFMQRYDDETRVTFSHEKLSAYFVDGNPDIGWSGLSEWLDDKTCRIISTLVSAHHEKKLLSSTVKEDSEEWWKACIVSEADNLSSSEREPSDNIELLPLESVFSYLYEDTPKEKQYYSYHPISQNLELHIPSNIKSTVGDYKSHVEAFIGEFKELVRKSQGNIKIETLLNLLQKYLWCIPSAYFKALPTISLFDHLKTTTAIAVILWKKLGDSNIERSLDALKNERSKQHFSLICADLSGIQNFIYTISPKGALRGLKGRSFYLQLLSKAVSRYILDKLNLPVTNLLYASGGRIYILSQNVDDQLVADIEHSINSFLLKELNANVYVAISAVGICGNDFINKENEERDISMKWGEVSRKVGERKRQKFLRNALEDKSFFEPFGNTGTPERCGVCGKDVSGNKSKIVDDVVKCDFCLTMENLGAEIRTGNSLIEIQDSLSANLITFQFDGFRIFYDLKQKVDDYRVPEDGSIRFYNINHSDHFIYNHLSKPNVETGFLFLGGTNPPSGRQGIKTTDELAQDSKGVKRLGILRMDVDNLGMAFACGFERKIRTISILTSFSFMLDFFFGCLIENAMDKVESPTGEYGGKGVGKFAYTIYSGGDDLFIIGAWDCIVLLAQKIREQFSRYSCNKLTLSAGIHISKHDFPIHRAAAVAGDAEEQAKLLCTNNGSTKDAVCFLNRPVKWEVFSALQNLAYTLTDGIENKGVSKSILSRLYSINASYNGEKKTLQKTALSKEEILIQMAHTRWRWLSVYNLGRFKERQKAFAEEIAQIQEFLANNKWKKTTVPEAADIIEVPVRWAELLTRKEG